MELYVLKRISVHKTMTMITDLLYGHLINNIIGCNNIVLDSMSKFNLKIETNFIKYCMGKGEWGITLVELGKEWGRVIECSLL